MSESISVNTTGQISQSLKGTTPLFYVRLNLNENSTSRDYIKRREDRSSKLFSASKHKKFYIFLLSMFLMLSAVRSARNLLLNKQPDLFYATSSKGFSLELVPTRGQSPGNEVVLYAVFVSSSSGPRPRAFH